MKAHPFVGQEGQGCEYVEAGTVCSRGDKSDVHRMKNTPAYKAASETMKKLAGDFSKDFVPAGDGEAVIAFTAYSEAVLELVRQKDAAYGGAWQKQGYMGNLARIMSKTERLKNMLWREQPWLGTGGEESAEEQEAVLDTLKDLMALCAFMGANIEDGNRWGK